MSERPIGYLEPFEGESISHYLGRYRRQPIVSVSSAISLGLATDCGSIFYRWENLYFTPRPTTEEITLVCAVIGLKEEELIRLLPAAHESVIIQPVRLCAACYRVNPWHLMEWQYRACEGCNIHGLKLLIRCPGCQNNFVLPALWKKLMTCEKCGFSFRRMYTKQVRFINSKLD